MQLDIGAIKFGKMQAAAAIAVGASILLWAYFLNAAGIAVNDFFTFKLHILLDKIISVNFLLFIIAFPLTGAIITALAKKMRKINLMLFSLLSALVALSAAMLLFPPLQGFWILFLFYIIAIPLRIETAYIKYAELERFVSMRTFLATAGRGALVIGIGLFVLSSVTILADQEAYVGKFEATFIENIFRGFTTGKSQQQLAGSLVDTLVESQLQTVNAILENPLFSKLREKNDPDVIAFVAASEAAKEEIQSSEYRQQLVSQFSAGSSPLAEQINIVEMLKRQLPFIETLERFLWLLHAFILASAFFLLANVVFKPLAVAYGMPIEKILGTFAQEGEK